MKRGYILLTAVVDAFFAIKDEIAASLN